LALSAAQLTPEPAAVQAMLRVVVEAGAAAVPVASAGSAREAEGDSPEEGAAGGGARAGKPERQ
jgi:hypothetical protein